MKRTAAAAISALILFNMHCACADVLKTGISLMDEIPRPFYGSWIVEAELAKTSNPELFELSSVDIWTLERSKDYVTLSNPLTGASASIHPAQVKGMTAKFEKISVSPDGEMYETPVLTLQGNGFYGTDKIVIKKFDKGKQISEDYVIYKVRGVKISGALPQKILE